MNYKVVNVIMAIVVVGLSYNCQSEKFQDHEDGYQYMFIEKGDGKLPDDGDLVTYNMIYTNEKDSVLFESSEEHPTIVPYNTQQWDNTGPLYKAFKIIRGGDSIIIKIPTKVLYAESFKMPILPGLDPEGEITFYIGASKIMTEEEMRAEALGKSKELLNTEIEIIETFLKENNITAQSTESGLRYVIDVEGTGDYPQPGESVKVQYTGTLLDGTKFDSSYDRPEQGPFSFLIGRRQVIQGWDEGIALLKTGGKGTLYIPSSLAYGPQAKSEVIKANSILKFEVELVGIE